MGDELVTGLQPPHGGSRNAAPISFTEVFREQLPYYLYAGMSWQDFWDGDAEMVVYYRKADRLRRKQKNQELWLQGMYVYEAIGDMSPVLRASFDKKPKKPLEYPKEPYPLDKRDVIERKRAEEKAKIEKGKAFFESWAVRTNNKFKNKGVVTDERSNGYDKY